MTARSGRRSVTLWVAGFLALAIVVAVTGFGGSVPAVAFRQAGHWVYNGTVGAVFHIDGGSKTVDSKMALPGLTGANQVVQDDRNGYVVDRRGGRVLVFGKSSLSVDSALSVGSTEEPVSLEVNGGPYLVYEHGGRIIRLGQPPATIRAGGQLQTPVTTTDGTLWVRRSGSLCVLPAGGHALRCPGHIPAGDHGALTTVDDHPAFVDVTASTITPVGTKGLGTPRRLGVTLTADAQVASSDAGGRLPIVSQTRGQQALVLVDASTIAAGSPAAKPITVPLRAGKLDAPVTSGAAIAVVNRSAHTIFTFTNQGARKTTVPLPASAGTVAVSRGEDGRVYVDNAAGTQTYVVDGDGSVTPVKVGGPGPSGPPGSTATPTPIPTATPSAPKPTASPTGSTRSPTRPPKPTPTRTRTPVPPPPTDAPPTTQPPTTPPATTPPPTTPPAQPPGAPADLSATAGNAEANLSWAAPASNGAPLTSYRVSWRGVDGGASGSTTVPGTSLHATIGGLTNGTSYVASVAAINRAGTGPSAQSGTFEPNPELTAPTDVTASASTDGAITVRWHGVAATTAGAVRFEVSTSGGRAVTTTGTQTVFTGLTLGTSYRFTVTAIAGSQRLSSSSGAVVPYAAAAAPTGLKATPGKGQIALSWAAPTLNGGRLVDYVVSYNGHEQTTTAPSLTVTGLSTGSTYSFSVHAVTTDPNGTGTKVTGAAASVSARAIAPPVVTIQQAYIDSDDVLHVKVHVDDGGSATTCHLTVLITFNKGACSGDTELTQSGINNDTNTNLPISVYGTNAAGTGPTDSSSVSSPHSHSNNVPGIPPGRMTDEARMGDS